MASMRSSQSTTTGPLAKDLDMSRRQISRLVAAGVIRANRVGARGRYRVPATELARLRRQMGRKP